MREMRSRFERGQGDSTAPLSASFDNRSFFFAHGKMSQLSFWLSFKNNLRIIF